MRKQWQTTIWVDQDLAESITLYAETQQSLRGDVRHWVAEHQPNVFRTHARGSDDSRSISYRYRPDPDPRDDWHGPRTPDEQADADARAKAAPWEYWQGRSNLGRNTFDEALDHFVNYIVITKGPEFVNPLLDEHGEIVDQRIVNMREFSPEQVNAAIARGWCVLSTNRTTSGYGDQATVVVMVHPEIGVS